jgi:phosphate transport system permease protein
MQWAHRGIVRHQEIVRHSGARSMTWLTASAVVIALFTTAAFLALLVWLSVDWFSPSMDTLLTLPQRLDQLLSAKPSAGLGFTGLAPAIFGTVLLVILMTLVLGPFAVAVAIYLSEYARRGWYTDVVRIAIQNLAGVPSIIYGVFGLGFFIYVIGASIDDLFFAGDLPQPTFGTPGLLWAALTMALMNLPVVVVATLEGLSRVPQEQRYASLALGATQWETLRHITLPAVLPSILTGLILSVARAAGEVAPLMLVGAVKYAPTSLVDGRWPFVHLEQKFMHLGYQVYDVAMHAQLDSGRLELIAVTALLLVIVVVALNLSAILLRLRLGQSTAQSESL